MSQFLYWSLKRNLSVTKNKIRISPKLTDQMHTTSFLLSFLHFYLSLSFFLFYTKLWQILYHWSIPQCTLMLHTTQSLSVYLSKIFPFICPSICDTYLHTHAYCHPRHPPHTQRHTHTRTHAITHKQTKLLSISLSHTHTQL